MKKQLKYIALVFGLLSGFAQANLGLPISVGNTVQEMDKLLRNQLTNDQLRELAQRFLQAGDLRTAFNTMHILALKDDRRAQLDLGRFYFRGDGVAQDYGKAYWWFSEAAEKGSAMALTNLGILYAGGYGIKKNLPHAISLLEKAASANDSHAMLVLGM